MPEYNDFESVQNTDLVNLATGDFTYSIPLITVPGPSLGFPVVLSYHAGIQPEQEASWVGLGWNLQSGAITRRVNNVPDEFNGDLIHEEITSQHIHGWLASIGWNGVTIGVSWDSEHGVGGMIGYSYGMATSEGSAFSLGVGVTAGTNGVYQGVGITASASVGKDMGDSRASAGLSIGVNSERGFTAGLSAGVDLTHTSGQGANATHTSASLANVGVSLSSHGINPGASSGVGFSSQSSLKGNVSSSSMNVWIPIFTPWTGYMELNWGSWDVYIDGLQEDHYYGFLHSDKSGMGCSTGSESCYQSDPSDLYKPCSDCDLITRVKKMDYNTAQEFVDVPGSTEPLKLGYTGEDIYSVQTEGLSGTFKPYRTEDGDYYTYLSNQSWSHQTVCDDGSAFGYIGAFFGGTCTRHTDIPIPKYMEGGVSLPNDQGGVTYIPNRNYHTNSNSVVWRFDSEVGGALFTDPVDREATAAVASGSTRIEPQFSGNQIAGWIITNSSGARYLYATPVINYAQKSQSSNVADLNVSTSRELPGYPYAWLLTAILSTDYVKMVPGVCTQITNEGCLPHQGDLGGWIRFDYTNPQNITWRTPLGTGGSPSSYGLAPNDPPDANYPYATSYSASMGVKSVRYLSSIETPTHLAFFNLGNKPREDGIAPSVTDIRVPVDPNLAAGNPIGTDYCSGNNSILITKYNYVFTIKNAINGASVKLMTHRKKMGAPLTDRQGNTTCAILDEEQTFGDFILTTDASGTATISINNVQQITRAEVDYNSSLVAAASTRLPYLDNITLFNKTFDNKQVSSVRFKYDYSLAQRTTNSNSLSFENGGDKGRLTLRSVQIGASSIGPWNPPYLFEYNGPNPNYDSDKKDIWGDYCAQCAEMKRIPDGSANAWNMTKITDPSGSEIKVDYEPKTIDFNGNTPAIIDGTSIGDYLTPQDGIVNVGTLSSQPSFAVASNPNSIAREISDYFSGKKIVFLGRYDFKFRAIPDAEEIKVDFSQLPHLAGATYVMEAPTLNSPGSGDDEMIIGQRNLTGSIPSSRKNCASGINCTYSVGKISSQPFGTESFYSHSHYTITVWSGGEERVISQDYPHTADPYWIRVWAVLDNAQPEPTVFGGGIRVSKVQFREPFSDKKNIITYSYRNSATPSLPQMLSNYSLDIKSWEVQGIKAFQGNPGVLHGQVTASFNFSGSPAYSTEYNFLTSKDLPVRLTFMPSTGPAGYNLRYKARILDQSGLWGSLWKKVDSTSSQKVARVYKAEWTNRLSSTIKADLGLSSVADLGLTRDQKPVLLENDAHTKALSVASDNAQKASEEYYFGLSQKLWSNRFISKHCEDAAPPQQNSCLEADQGAFSTQIEVVRAVPLLRQEVTSQDKASDTTEANDFDYLTGTPLWHLHRNTKPDGSPEFDATLASLAYHHYSDMKDSNMLTQEFSTTTFRFNNDPGERFYSGFSAGDLASVGSSQFTLWKNYGGLSSKPVLYRKFESFALRDTSGFALPEIIEYRNPKWISQGRNVAYDGFSHVIESEIPNQGERVAEIYGYGQSLPTAFVQHGRQNEIFYQSFEINDEVKAQLAPVATSFGLPSLRSKTGSKALKVANCFERTTAGPYVDKDICRDPSSAGSTPVYFRDRSMTCFALPKLSVNQTYEASAWYYDEYAGADPNNPASTVFNSKFTQVTRPGIFIGVNGGCAVQDFPDGVLKDDGGYTPAAANGDKNADQRALGDKKWKRLTVDFNPSACSQENTLDNAILCLYASKGTAGSDVTYDEVRVRPKNSLMTTYTYDHRGNMTSTADANEVTRHFQYDAFGNLSGIKNDDGVQLGAQAKKYGAKDPQFSLDLSNDFDQGCEEFKVKSNPSGFDTEFDFISADNTSVSSSLKTSIEGKSVHTLCYDPPLTFNLKLLMHATGKIKTFTVTGNAPLIIQSPVLQHLAVDPFPTPWDQSHTTYNNHIYVMNGRIHAYNGAGPKVGGEFFAFHLPNEVDFKDLQKIPRNSVLKSYLIKIEIQNIPQKITFPDEDIDQTDDFPTAAGIDSHLSHRMHFRYNFFARDMVDAAGSVDFQTGETGNFQLSGHQFKWAPNRANWDIIRPNSPPPKGNCFDSDAGVDANTCFDLLRYGDVKCKDNDQSPEKNCDPPQSPGSAGTPVSGGTYTIRKYINWPLSFAQRRLSAMENPTNRVISDNPLMEVADYATLMYDGDFIALNGLDYTFVFSLFRHLSNVASLWDGWHPEALTRVDGSKKDNIDIKITIIPVTE